MDIRDIFSGLIGVVILGTVLTAVVLLIVHLTVAERPERWVPRGFAWLATACTHALRAERPHALYLGWPQEGSDPWLGLDDLIAAALTGELLLDSPDFHRPSIRLDRIVDAATASNHRVIIATQLKSDVEYVFDLPLGAIEIQLR